jgi:hypothetical protein
MEEYSHYSDCMVVPLLIIFPDQKLRASMSLQAVFAEIHSSKRALDIIARFESVCPRAALREALHKCMLTAFSRYSLELDEIQNTYEKHKVHLYNISATS